MLIGCIYSCTFSTTLTTTPILTPIEYLGGLELRHQDQNMRVQILGHPFAGCVTLTLDELFILSVPQFPHL